jgi:hypothetical protein
LLLISTENQRRENMSDEDLEAGADSPSVAVEASVEAATADTASDEAPASSAPSLSDDTESSEPAPVSFPSHDDFGWDDWDGTHDTLPEPVRGWGSRLSDHYTSQADAKIKAHEESSDHTRKLYEALMGGDEDPRVAEYSTKLTEWEGRYGDLDDKYTTMQTEYEGFKANVEAAIEAEADAYAKTFRETNSDIFESNELATKFADLLEEGWDLETAAKASRLSDAVLGVARKAKADGVPDAYALQIAASNKQRPSQPRPGAQLTSGATTPSRPPAQSTAPNTDAMSLADWRSHVARNALSKTKTRRA